MCDMHTTPDRDLREIAAEIRRLTESVEKMRRDHARSTGYAVGGAINNACGKAKRVTR